MTPFWGPRLQQTLKIKTLTVTSSSVFPSGSWTPTLTFVTPGDLAVTYTTRLADYIDFGRTKVLTFDIVTSSFTHTTASGALIISGVPVVSVTLAGHVATGSMLFGGITKAGYTAIAPAITSANNLINIQASGSGVAVASVVAADVPSGGTVNLSGTIIYRTS